MGIKLRIQSKKVIQIKIIQAKSLEELQEAVNIFLETLAEHEVLNRHYSLADKSCVIEYVATLEFEAENTERRRAF